MIFHVLARLVAVLLSCCGSALPSGTDAPPPCWRPPVEGVITDPFRPPPCPFCAGNRGLEYATADPAVVHAVAAGRVVFAGSVAGTVYVVVELPAGWRLTYGELSRVFVERGEAVLAGDRLGEAAGTLHFGLRVGDTYRDPAPYLGMLVGVARLVPIDGSTARPAPPARLTCRTDGGTDRTHRWSAADARGPRPR